MPLTLEQKSTAFDKLDAMIDGRDGKGKSRYFQAMCQLLKDLSAELKRDPVKLPADWVRK